MRIGVNGRTLVSERTGLGRYVVEMCRALGKAGHHTIIYLPSPPSSSLPALDNVEYRIGNAFSAARRNIWAQTTLPSTAMSDEVDIFWGPAHRLPRFLSTRIPRVVTIHDLVWLNASTTMRFQSWLGDKFLMKPAIQLADRVVADSYCTAEQIAIHFPSAKDKINVIYPGLTLIAPNPRSEILRSKNIDRKYALFVGTLEPRKNLQNLLSAYSLLPESVRDSLLLVIAGGAGWKTHNLASQIQKMKLERHVRLTGYVSDEDLQALYANAQFLAMPSLNEGFGFPIIEANAAGKPALTSNVSSMPEVAGDAAILVDPLSVHSIADGMLRLATDFRVLELLSVNALANASRFNWVQSADKLIGAFEQAIAARTKMHS